MIQFPEHIDRIATLTEVTELRHRVISHNLANVNTPGYQRLDVSFDEQLFKARRHAEAGPVSHPTVIQDPDRTPGMDGNSVDIDHEIGQLKRNSMLFQTYAQILSTHFDTMRRAMGRS